MSNEPGPPDPDPLQSAFRTRHPRIAEEIEGAIKTLTKLKEIATPGSFVAPGAGGESPATMAMTQSLQTSGFTPAGGETQAFARTEAEPVSDAGEVPLLVASSTFGRYQIVRMLGRGAMGAVYLAYDTDLHRHVAIKTPSLGRSTQTIDRFYREARAAAQLRSPYLCPIYDVGKVGDIHYLSMAFIDGVPLTKVMAQRQLQTVGAIVKVVGKIARGLQKAHEAGIVHRDLKPDNIMMDTDGEPIVLDFGLARRVNDDAQVTLPGMIVGTPAFMSPEQIDGDPTKIGPATDIYSLGIVLYQMLTGQLPFKGSITSILQQVGSKDPVKPSALNESIGEDSPVEQICLKMVAKAAADRYASMAEAAAALESLGGSGTEAAVPPMKGVGRLKSWSTGILSSLVRGGGTKKLTIEASSGESPDPTQPTIAEPR